MTLIAKYLAHFDMRAALFLVTGCAYYKLVWIAYVCQDIAWADGGTFCKVSKRLPHFGLISTLLHAAIHALCVETIRQIGRKPGEQDGHRDQIAHFD